MASDESEITGDRRAAKRYHCKPATLVPLYLTGASTSLDAWGWDLSATGISLDMPCSLDVGTAVVLRPTKSLLMPARVVHATKRHNGTWRIGCKFDHQLDSETLEALL